MLTHLGTEFKCYDTPVGLLKMISEAFRKPIQNSNLHSWVTVEIEKGREITFFKGGEDNENQGSPNL